MPGRRFFTLSLNSLSFFLLSILHPLSWEFLNSSANNMEERLELAFQRLKIVILQDENIFKYIHTTQAG